MNEEQNKTLREKIKNVDANILRLQAKKKLLSEGLTEDSSLLKI